MSVFSSFYTAMLSLSSRLVRRMRHKLIDVAAACKLTTSFEIHMNETRPHAECMYLPRNGKQEQRCERLRRAYHKQHLDALPPRLQRHSPTQCNAKDTC